MASCAVLSASEKKALVEAYKDKNYSENHLVHALQLCRKYHEYDNEWFPDTPARKAVFTRFLNYYLTYARLSDTSSTISKDSIYNLYTTLYALYSPEQLDNRINMIARDFREVVDRLEKAMKDRGMTRQEVIESRGDKKNNGYVNLIGHVFSIYEKSYTDPEKMMANYLASHPNATEKEISIARRAAEYRAEQYKIVLANKERLAALAAVKIGEDEGFIVNVRGNEISFEEYDENNSIYEGFEDYGEDEGADKEEGSKGDRYGDFRTVKLMSTLSARAKRLLSDLQKIDSNGRIIRDDLGVAQHVGPRQAAVVLSRALVNSSPDTLLSDLEAAANVYPWINGLVAEINKNPDIKRTIYSNFKKAETTFVYGEYDNGSYNLHVANSRSRGNALMREAGTNMRSGFILDEKNSLYTGFGGLRSAETLNDIHDDFKKLKGFVQKYTRLIKMVEGDKATSQKTIDKAIDEGRQEGVDLSYLNLSGNDAMAAFLRNNPDVIAKLSSFLRGMGFAVSPKDISTIASQDMKPKGFAYIAGRSAARKMNIGRNKLYQLVEWMDGVYNRAEEVATGNKPKTGQYLYNTATSELNRVNRCLSLSQYKDVEARVLVNGKQLSTYNNVNLLHQTFDELTNRRGQEENDYQDYLEREFLQYEGMSLGYGTQRKSYGWLERFRTNEDNIREKMRVADISSFKFSYNSRPKEYFELSRPQKLKVSLSMFFDGGRILGADNFAAYEVPIQADYSTAYNFISAPKLSKQAIIDALTDEVLIELERIAAIQERQADKNRVKLEVYEKQGNKLQIFPELNDTGFIAEYTSIEDTDAARAFVRENVASQLENIVARDMNTLEKAGVFMDSALKTVDAGFDNKVSFYNKKGNFADLKQDAKDALEMYALNVFYAREQITKITTGGLEQFSGLIDYEKRNMLSHATRTSLDTTATWKGQLVTTINGKKYKNSKDAQNVAYIEDDESDSNFLSDIKEMLQVLNDENIINERQFATMSKSYTDINTTDGVGLRTLESYRTVMIMSDMWDDRHEEAFKNIVIGKPKPEDIDIFMQNIKPVLTGYETVPVAAGDKQKPVKLTVLHKYAEMVLLPEALSKYCLQQNAVPFRAFDKAQDELKKQGKEVDMFLFHSGVKVGAHSIIRPFEKQNGERLLKTEDGIKDYIVERVNANGHTIHTLPFKYYGIAASTPAHVADDKIAWAAQAEKVAWANIDPKDEKALANRKLYNDIKTAEIIETYTELRRMFVNTDELERMFQEELASKSYSSRELTYALAHLRDGTFALPLYSPNIEHQVQQLLASIIKKRLTKPMFKGANILQSTGLGMDIEASNFSENDALTKDEKLEIKFVGKGKNKRIKYVEVYMPIHDSRLKQFADKNGEIRPDRLQKLIDEKIIPESILEFVAYRTPSDAEHSVIPCRIKGFVANTAGATIRMPKEVMVMTGHDYDGDKLRCHFKNFNIVDKEKDADNSNLVKVILGQKPISSAFGKKVEAIDYDYSKTPLENTSVARANARVEMIFAQLTSPSGSRRVVIPGGCEETKAIAKSMYLVRMAKDKSAKDRIRNAMLAQEIGESVVNAAMKNASSLYEALHVLSDSTLTKIVREASGSESPFSVTHSSDAYEYIMGGADMISKYALYNSALQTLQRTDMHYVPRRSENNNPYKVKILDTHFDKLFSVKNSAGELASLGLARLLNAAVDNNKDPILGYINQGKELSAITFLMFAAGMPEEDIHLFLNQPVVLELTSRMKQSSAPFSKHVNSIVNELKQSQPYQSEDTQWSALEDVAELGREDFTKTLAASYEDILRISWTGDNADILQNQVDILLTLAHLNNAAENLSTFVRLTRPESDSGSIGATISDITAKVIDLNKFRDRLKREDDSRMQISGMREILKKRDVHEGWDNTYIETVLSSSLPEIVALNSLMMDTSLEMFSPYFPQAKQSWYNVIQEVASGYKYAKTQPKVSEKIATEMILWRLLDNKKFIPGDSQDEQKDIIINVPKRLTEIKERIAQAQKNPGKDVAADALVGNVFLDKLAIFRDEDGKRPARISFTLNGPAVEGTADAIRANWNALLLSTDEDIRNFAVDLFKYNLYTNGLAYGMYEFAHFAPFSVLMKVPNYVEALRDVMNYSWDDEVDKENFINQYYMNHWEDTKLLNQINISDISTVKLPDGVKGQIWISNKTDEFTVKNIIGERYVIIRHGKNNSEQDLYRVLPGTSEAVIVLEKAQKLGAKNRNQQVWLQYNPSISYTLIEPVVAPNETIIGEIDEANVFAQANYSNPQENRYADDPLGLMMKSAPTASLGIFGLPDAAVTLQNVEEAAIVSAQKNEGKLPNGEEEAVKEVTGKAPVVQGAFGLGPVNMELLEGAVKNVGTGEMLNIVKRDDSGKIISENVPATPDNVKEARRQQIYVELNKRLREILRNKGIDVGVLTDAEARMSIGGVADFDTATVTAEGLLELIRIAEGYEGDQALPEEFAHVALEMLGHDHPLVQRLLNILMNNDEAMQEAYNGMYDEYAKEYGEQNRDKLALEAAGKLVAKHLFMRQEIESKPVRGLISRIVDAIKSFFKRFRRDDIQNTIFDANQIASRVAREMLGGKLLDEMALENISQSGEFKRIYSKIKKEKVDITNKNDILSKLLKNEYKRLSILKRRLAYAKTGDKENKSIPATELQIKKLESAIKNHKAEDAIVTYMLDSLDFLKASEQSMTEAASSGKPMNVVCKKLNIVRDTIYSFYKALDYINEAIIDGEVEESSVLRDAIDELNGVLMRFNQNYTKIGRHYFEEMLSSVYGREGVTVTIGKEKGRKISLKEMSTKTDHDISTMSRLFNAIADCNDYALKAFDSIVRDAKLRARRRAYAIRPRIEAAIYNLEKETGSRDQSFMFETKTENGRTYRTGKYISRYDSRKLSDAQRKFYNTMMEIKKEADMFLPDVLLEDYKIVMMRKSTMEKFKEAEGAKGKAIEAWEGLKNRVMDTSSDWDEDTHRIIEDFQDTRVDLLPVKFLYKGKNETYDDMSDDVATSMMAYAGMAFEYGEMSGVIGTLENAKYMASEREVTKRTGFRIQREKIDVNGTTFQNNYTVKQARTNLQKALEDFFQMHVYGHLQKDEGTLGNTQISKRKAIDAINGLTSMSQMALNLPQRIANVSTGFTQIAIESAGQGVFNIKDVTWGSAIWTANTGDRLAETGKTDSDNKLSLWMEYFDIHQDNGRNKDQYKKSRMSRIFNTHLLYSGLTIGEDYLAAVTSLAAARNYKVKYKDEAGNEHVTNLWDAYTVEYVDKANKVGAYLKLKDGYTKEDGSPITAADERAFAKKVIGLNFDMQGIYNTDDRSAVQQYAFGALIIMYRKWIAPALKRRYGATQYSELKGHDEEGYWNTLFHFIYNTAKEAKAGRIEGDEVSADESEERITGLWNNMNSIINSVNVNWSKLNPYEKSNIHRAFTELGILIGISACIFLLGKLPPDDDGNEQKILSWAYSSMYANLLRLRTEIGAQAPTPRLIDESLKILKSPFAAIGPMRDALNVFQFMLPQNYFMEIKSGRYKGHKKVYKYFRNLPIISMFKKVDNFIDPSPLINYYKNDSTL